MSEPTLNLNCGNCSRFIPEGRNNHSYCGVNGFGVEPYSEACFYYGGEMTMFKRRKCDKHSVENKHEKS